MLRQKIMKEENIDNEIKMEALLLSKESESESGWMRTHIQRVANMENLIEVVSLIRSIQKKAKKSYIQNYMNWNRTFLLS